MYELFGKLLTRRLFEHPILVVGTGRSGTSILLQALGQHSQVLSADRESPFIPYLGYLVHPFEFRHNKEYQIDSLNTPIDYLYDQVRRICFESVMGKNYGLKSVNGDIGRMRDAIIRKRYWCAKTYPSAAESQGLIRLYPSIKFVYVFRNGCDVVNSRSRFRGMSGLDFAEHCHIWADAVEKYDYLLDNEYAITVRHEHIVADPDRTFHDIATFLGISQEPGPANFTKTTHVHPLNKRTQVDVDVAKAFSERPPVYESWSAEQRDLFRSICSDGMTRLGYEIPF